MVGQGWGVARQVVVLSEPRAVWEPIQGHGWSIHDLTGNVPSSAAKDGVHPSIHRVGQ